MVAAAAPVAGKLSQTCGRPRVMAGGFVLSAVGFGVLSQIRLEGFSPLVVLLIGAGLVAAGIVSVMTLVTDYVVGVAPADRAGAVGGLIETSNELGGAFGIAILGCVLAAVYRHAVTPFLPTELAPEAARGSRADHRRSIGRRPAFADGSRGPNDEGFREAFITAMHATCIVSAVILLLATAVTVILLRDKKKAVSTAA
ncbi:hypothetical protein VQ056_00580 [Paenibacillus sp. JTLBN-2024]